MLCIIVLGTVQQATSWKLELEFQSPLLQFLKGPCISVQVFNLRHDLKQEYVRDYVCEGGQTSLPYTSSFTLGDVLCKRTQVSPFLRHHLLRQTI